mgnify:CR=1 FL=1
MGFWLAPLFVGIASVVAGIHLSLRRHDDPPRATLEARRRCDAGRFVAAPSVPQTTPQRSGMRLKAAHESL